MPKFENTEVAYSEGYLQGVEDSIKEIDKCWGTFSKGASIHHHKIKRAVFLRFRKRVEALIREPSF